MRAATHGFTFQVLRRLAIAIAIGLVWSPQGVAQKANDPNAAYDALLKRYVSVDTDGINRVDYARWNKSGEDRKVLDAYITELSALKPSAMSRDQAMAYWGNLYNAITLKVILDKYPVASIRDIKGDSWFDFKSYIGPWRQERVTVEGKKLSLDNIEHDIMRPTFKDPRVHYVVNCASIGCPNLMNRAWRAETLTADLDAAAKAFINNPRGVTVLPSGGLKVSSIYSWFAVDFGGDDASLVAHFKKYAQPELAARLTAATKVETHAYDWTLNQVAVAGKPGG